SKPRSRRSRIKTQVIGGQRPAALLMVIVMLVHYARSAPFPEGAPAQSAGSAGHPDQFESPLRMRFVCSISGNRGLSEGYQQTADFGHHVKRNQEVGEKCAHSRLSTNRFFCGFATYLDIVVIKCVKNLKVLFEAFVDLGLEDGRV